MIHTREWARIEEFVDYKPLGFGRPGNDRGVLAHAFLAKAILGIATTVGLVERLSVDKTLRRICGFPMWRKIPTESTFSRAFAEFARTRLGERVHEALVKEALGGTFLVVSLEMPPESPLWRSTMRLKFFQGTNSMT